MNGKSVFIVWAALVLSLQPKVAFAEQITQIDDLGDKAQFIERLSKVPNYFDAQPTEDEKSNPEFSQGEKGNVIDFLKKLSTGEDLSEYADDLNRLASHFGEAAPLYLQKWAAQAFLLGMENASSADNQGAIGDTTLVVAEAGSLGLLGYFAPKAHRTLGQLSQKLNSFGLLENKSDLLKKFADMELAQKSLSTKTTYLAQHAESLKEQMHQQAKQLEDAKSEQTKLQKLTQQAKDLDQHTDSKAQLVKEQNKLFEEIKAIAKQGEKINDAFLTEKSSQLADIKGAISSIEEKIGGLREALKSAGITSSSQHLDLFAKAESIKGAITDMAAKYESSYGPAAPAIKQISFLKELVAETELIAKNHTSVIETLSKKLGRGRFYWWSKIATMRGGKNLAIWASQAAVPMLIVGSVIHIAGHGNYVVLEFNNHDYPEVTMQELRASIAEIDAELQTIN